MLVIFRKLNSKALLSNITIRLSFLTEFRMYLLNPVVCVMLKKARVVMRICLLLFDLVIMILASLITHFDVCNVI